MKGTDDTSIRKLLRHNLNAFEQAVDQGSFAQAAEEAGRIAGLIRLRDSLASRRNVNLTLLWIALVAAFIAAALGAIPLRTFNISGTINAEALGIELLKETPLVLDLPSRIDAVRVSNATGVNVDGLASPSSRSPSSGLLAADVLSVRRLLLPQGSTLVLTPHDDGAVTLRCLGLRSATFDASGADSLRALGRRFRIESASSALGVPSSVTVDFADAAELIVVAEASRLSGIPPLQASSLWTSFSPAPMAPGSTRITTVSAIQNAGLSVPALQENLRIGEGEALIFDGLDAVAYGLRIEAGLLHVSFIGSARSIEHGFPSGLRSIRPTMADYVQNVFRRKSLVMALLSAIAISWGIYERFRR